MVNAPFVTLGPVITVFGFLRRPPAALAAKRATRRYGAEPKAIPVVIALASTGAAGTEVDAIVLVTGAALTGSTFFISTGAALTSTGLSAFGKV